MYEKCAKKVKMSKVCKRTPTKIKVYLTIKKLMMVSNCSNLNK